MLFGEAFQDIRSNRNWKATAWVLGGPAGEQPGVAAEISDYTETTNAAAFTAKLPSGEAWVVVSMVQDGGWSARDETGSRLDVRRANGPFLAVRVPAGSHRVRLRYLPPGFSVGLAIGAATAVLLIGLAVARASRKRPRTAG